MAEKFDPTKQEPVPKRGTHNVTDYVIEDLLKRESFGIDKYGMPLEANNGRDALKDAYQEALDLAKYLRQALLERDGG